LSILIRPKSCYPPLLGFLIYALNLRLGGVSQLSLMLHGLSRTQYSSMLNVCVTLFGFCLLTPSLFLGHSPSFGFRLPSMFLFCSPLCLDLPSPPFLLGLLPCFDLFNSPALFWRYPRRIQCFHDLLTKALDPLLDGSRPNIEVTQSTPIDVLTAPNNRENGIISPFGLTFERTN
jgi:hypothetical protein